jgi:hypothetical protein
MEVGAGLDHTSPTARDCAIADRGPTIQVQFPSYQAELPPNILNLSLYLGIFYTCGFVNWLYSSPRRFIYNNMFRPSARRLAAAAAKAAAAPTSHTINVSRAQGVSRGLTGGAHINSLNDEAWQLT